MKLTDHQWKVIEPLLPELRKREDGRGRPWIESRSILDGILWILRSGARWKDMPSELPPYQTCHRRFQQWIEEGVMERILEFVAADLRDRGKLDLTETFIDGSFSSAKKGVQKSVRQNVEKARKSWQLQTALVFLSPLGLRVLHHMKLNSLKTQLKTDSLTKLQIESSEIKPMTVIHLMTKFNPSMEWNSLLLTRQIAKASGLKTEEHSGATLDDGESNDYLHGFTTSDES